jgi:predicted NBD/HSP70 family sugar kinase
MDALLADAAAGEAAALAALAETGRWVGIGLAGLVNILNPRLVVFGGLFERIHPFIGSIVEAELDRRTLPAPRRLVRIVAGTLGAEAPLLGAAELALEPVLADPALWLNRTAIDLSEIAKIAVRRVVA